MRKKMDMSFWVPAIGGLVLTIAGASLGLWAAISSHNDSLEQKAKADRIASEQKQLLEQNYQKSVNIINELNKSSEKTKILLDNTNKVLESQKEAGILLTEQATASTKINTSILASGQSVVSSIDLASKNLDNNITGGDSYCTVEFTNTGKRSFSLSARNNFNNNLPNVILKVINYSAIEKCNFIEVEGIKRIDLNCFNANSLQISPMLFSVNTDYFIGGDNFIDVSGAEKKLTILILTTKNQFYQQIVYHVETDTKVRILYRMLKKINGKYLPIYTNDAKFDRDNPGWWDKEFSLNAEIPTFK